MQFHSESGHTEFGHVEPHVKHGRPLSGVTQNDPESSYRNHTNLKKKLGMSYPKIGWAYHYVHVMCTTNKDLRDKAKKTSFFCFHLTPPTLLVY